MDLKEWFEDEATEVTEATLKEFDKYVAEYLTVRERHADLEAQVTEVNKKLNKMQSKLRQFLEAQGVTSYNTRLGKLIINERVTFKPPEGEEREAVIDHLKVTGDYDSVAAFNAAKFSSWYKAQVEANPEFGLPGVKEDRLVYVSFRKG